jgi:hypothetical protein
MHPTTLPFQRYEKSSQAVLLADRRDTPALGEGPSTIPTVGRALPIQKALHVPLLKDHLISAAQVAKKHDILFQGSHVYIIVPGPRSPDPLVITRGHLTDACTSYTHVAIKQRLFTSTVDLFIFLPTFYSYTARLIISLPVLCVAFSSSTSHSNLPTMLDAQSRLYPAPLALRANRPVPPFGPLIHRLPVSFHVSIRTFVAPFPSRPKAHATYKLSSTTSPSTPLAYSSLKRPKRPLIFQQSSV